VLDAVRTSRKSLVFRVYLQGNQFSSLMKGRKRGKRRKNGVSASVT